MKTFSTVPEITMAYRLKARQVLRVRSGALPRLAPRPSRRTCLSLLATAVATPAVLAPTAPTAQAADQSRFKPAELTWQEYRNEAFGFRIEMPGRPEVFLDPDPAPF